MFVVKVFWGHLLQMTGEKTSVQKPLLSAGDVTDKGHALWLDGKRRLHHSERLTDSGSNAHVFFKEFVNNILGMEPLI